MVKSNRNCFSGRESGIDSTTAQPEITQNIFFYPFEYPLVIRFVTGPFIVGAIKLSLRGKADPNQILGRPAASAPQATISTIERIEILAGFSAAHALISASLRRKDPPRTRSIDIT